MFGGTHHKTFLGCLNCDKSDAKSIFNPYGEFGKGFAARSNIIWNQFGTFGNEFSDVSPWNEYALHPPVIVDGAGNFYGYFTVNEYFLNRTRVQFALGILAAGKGD